MRRGVGMYPDEACFDTTRPSWLPYWIDDLTESSCKVNLVVSGNTSGNTAQSGTFTSVTNPDGTTSVVSAADPVTIANAQAACAAQNGAWDSTLNTCSPNLLTQFVGGYGLYIGLGLAAVFLLSTMMGGRR